MKNKNQINYSIEYLIMVFDIYRIAILTELLFILNQHLGNMVKSYREVTGDSHPQFETHLFANVFIF